RPSALPKLSLCAWFRSEGTPNEAAERGTRIDKIYRQILRGLTDFPRGSASEIAAAVWAAEQTDNVVGSYPVLACEEECQVRIPEFPEPGECDAICPKAFCSFDVKSGLLDNYELQQAAYAYGLMARYFCDRWTVYVLFCDLHQIVTSRFEYEATKRLVLE